MPPPPDADPVPEPEADERLALAVHELTNPLAAIRLAAQLLDDADPAVVADARGVIEQQGARMAAVLKALADTVPPARRRPRGPRGA
jgi:nitrogen-specific signal transduction histidine kinase